jgi:hypothetical protein
MPAISTPSARAFSSAFALVLGAGCAMQTSSDPVENGLGVETGGSAGDAGSAGSAGSGGDEATGGKGGAGTAGATSAGASSGAGGGGAPGAAGMGGGGAGGGGAGGKSGLGHVRDAPHSRQIELEAFGVAFHGQ